MCNETHLSVVPNKFNQGNANKNTPFFPYSNCNLVQTMKFICNFICSSPIRIHCTGSKAQLKNEWHYKLLL